MSRTVRALLHGTASMRELRADRYYIDNDKCLSCHGGSYEELAKQTAQLGEYNPHQSPHGNLNCNECHKGHAAQVDTCGQCHPNGGQTMRGNN